MLYWHAVDSYQQMDLYEEEYEEMCSTNYEEH